jgi:hypothetical protein
MPRSIAATLIIALPLAGLFWLSGAVSLLAAAAAMTLFVFVVLSAGLLLLRAADAADLPAPAAWVLGVFATAIAVYALVMAFHLLAASAFAIWAALVLALGIFFREPRPSAGRMDRAELSALLLCAAATVFWCSDIAGAPQSLARDGVLTAWVDQFIHGATISQFGDPRAAGRQAIELSGLPRPFYHYASYMLPAAFAWPLDLPGLPLATSVWVPVGFFTLCAGAYVLGAALAGSLGGVAALAALTLLPDAASYGLHNLAFGYYWYVLAVPGASYGVGVCLLSIALLHRWAKRRSLRLLLASVCLVGGALLIRAHVFLLAFPAWLASALMLTPFIQRRKLAFFGAASASLALFVFAYYGFFPDAVPALPQFLEVSHHHVHHLNQPVYQAWYAGLSAAHGPLVTLAVGLLLIFPASLGVFIVLYPISVLLVHRSRGLEAIDLVPVALLVCYLLLMISAPIPANGDSTELTQRPFVLVYAVIAVWTAAGFVSWAAAQGGLRTPRVRLTLLLIAALWVAGVLFCTVGDARWTAVHKVHKVAEGLPQAARFLRSHWRRGDVFAVPGLWPGRSYTDAAIQLASLTGIPTYLSRPLIHANRGGRAKEAARERYEALVQVADEQDITAALARLRELGIRWYVVAEAAGPRWDPERRRAAFVAGKTAVYSSD